MALENFLTQYPDDKIIEIVEPHVSGKMSYFEIVNGLTMRFDIYDINEYRIVLTRCEEKPIAFATCNCKGWYFSQKCKHVHYVIIKKEGFTTNPSLTTLNNTKQGYEK